MELLDKIIPYLDKGRELIGTIAVFISKAFDLNPPDVTLGLIVLISIFASKKILEFFYTTLDGRKGYWVVLALIFFWVIKYLGA